MCIFPNGARKKIVFLTEVSAKESGEWDKKNCLEYSKSKECATIFCDVVARVSVKKKEFSFIIFFPFKNHHAFHVS